jgi:hypothetical protein
VRRRKLCQYEYIVVLRSALSSARTVSRDKFESGKGSAVRGKRAQQA